MNHLAPNVTAIRPTVYEDALRIALSAGNDWQKQLRAAQVLDRSPDWGHQNIARHIREAFALHEVGLLRPVAPVDHARASGSRLWCSCWQWRR